MAGAPLYRPCLFTFVFFFSLPSSISCLVCTCAAWIVGFALALLFRVFVVDVCMAPRHGGVGALTSSPPTPHPRPPSPSSSGAHRVRRGDVPMGNSRALPVEVEKGTQGGRGEGEGRKRALEVRESTTREGGRRAWRSPLQPRTRCACASRTLFTPSPLPPPPPPPPTVFPGAHRLPVYPHRRWFAHVWVGARAAVHHTHTRACRLADAM